MLSCSCGCGCQVTSAFWLLLGEALGQLGRAVPWQLSDSSLTDLTEWSGFAVSVQVLTHPKLAVAVFAVPVVYVALNVGRWFLGKKRFCYNLVTDLLSDDVSMLFTLFTLSHWAHGMSQAVLLHRVLDSECTPTLVLYTSAICKVTGNWRLALELFHEIAESSLEANDFSYGATLSACERAVAWSSGVMSWTVGHRNWDVEQDRLSLAAAQN